MDATLEVAVAAEDSSSDEVVVGNSVGDFLRKRAGVSDAGCASVSDGLEAECLQGIG